MEKIYWSNGKLHRKDGPAVIYEDGTQEWWLEGIRHRYDGPAIYNPNKKIVVNIKHGKIENQVSTYYGGLLETFIDPVILIQILSKITTTCEYIPSKTEKIKDKTCFYENGMLVYETYEKSSQNFYKYGVKHNDKAPAVIDNVNLQEIWYYYGMLHNTKGPAYIHITPKFTYYMWYQFGRLQSLNDDPAYLKVENKTKNITELSHYHKGKLHRENGPAVIMKEFEGYYNNGQLHNLNGSAYTQNGYKSYAINGKKCTEEQHKKIMKTVIKCIYKLRAEYRRKVLRKISVFNKDVLKNIIDYLL